jgi:hypothetical protein
LREVRVKLAGGFEVGREPGDRSKEPLRIEFKIEMKTEGIPGTGRIRIWNLSDSHRNAIGKELTDIEIEAGHREHMGGQGNISTIGKGQIMDFRHDRDRTDIVTLIEFADGGTVHRQGVISKNKDEGSTPLQLETAIEEEMMKHKVEKGEIKGVPSEPASKRPVVLYGPLAREMNVLSRSFGFQWWIQYGKLYTKKPDESLSGGIELISPSTGMIGAPTIKQNGIEVKTLLNPKLMLGHDVRVESDTLDRHKNLPNLQPGTSGAGSGTYNISSLTHVGDNKDGQFESHIEAVGPK